jgi:endonuclease/exonuclease/phosphatase family metal-dependent hydrolase
MRLMTYNILESGEGRIDPIAESIRQAGADVVVLQETWDRALAVKLADRVGMELFLAENPRNAQGAVALLSKFEIVEAVNVGAMDARVKRGMFSAVVRTESGGAGGAGNLLPIVGLHLHARETLEDEAIRMTELPAVLEAAAKFAGRGHVIAGDFNSVSPAQPVDVSKMRPKGQARIAANGGVIPTQVVTRILEAGYIDAHAIGRRPEEMQRSFTTSHLATRVDFIFVSPELAGRVEGCTVFDSPIGRFASDHYPVIAQIAS